MNQKVKGDDSLVLYVEPADTAVTGWIASIGYFFEGPLTVDESRVLYSSTDDQAVDGLVAPGGGLGEFQKAAGRYVTLDIPGGAVAGFVWLLATDGTVNVQVSTSS